MIIVYPVLQISYLIRIYDSPKDEICFLWTAVEPLSMQNSSGNGFTSGWVVSLARHTTLQLNGNNCYFNIYDSK